MVFNIILATIFLNETLNIKSAWVGINNSHLALMKIKVLFD